MRFSNTLINIVSFSGTEIKGTFLLCSGLLALFIVPGWIASFVRPEAEPPVSLREADSIWHILEARVNSSEKKQEQVGGNFSTRKSDATRSTPIESQPKNRKVALMDKDSLNLNTCDSLQLQSIYGIGPAFASRIVKYRNLLGGYVREDQLAEVYGLPDSTVSRVKERVFIKANYTPDLLPVNRASFKEILRHPYFSYEQTKAVVNHRNRYGAYGKVSHLEESGRDDFHSLLKYYLDFSTETGLIMESGVK